MVHIKKDRVEKNWVLVGSIGRPHGIKGWVKINSYTEPLNNILNYQPWHLRAPNKEIHAHPIEIISHRVNDQHIVVQFENCETPESARLFTNYKIYVQRQKFPQLPYQTYYWTDLEGLSVYTCENTYLGVVQSLFSTGSNDVLIVKGEKRHLIPFLFEHTIKSIDLEQQVIIVDWDPHF